MLLSRHALSGLLLALPLLGQAQTTTETAAPPRFYVGLAAYSSYYQSLESRHPGVTGSPVPLQLTAGYQLRPRLAVQVGLAYSGSGYAYSGDGYYYNLNAASNRGTYYKYAGNSTMRNTSASVLARYTLTRKAAHRVQFDALGGLTLEHRRGTDRGTYIDSLGGRRNVDDYDNREAVNSLLLTAGLGTRYRLSSRFDLTLDLLLNRSLNAPVYSDFRLGLTGSSALGLRYRFGKR